MSRIGKYELIELAGRGGAGEIWKARDTDLGRTVAVKLMQRTSHEDLVRFRREAQVTAKLNHPNIAQIYEFGENFIAMQYVDGRPIARPEHLVAAARAVHYAHQNGVLHRDLKPANILVDGSGRAYVLDFGLAREVRADATAMSLTGDILGTPSYMAPEQARGEVNRLDARTDVYGLGATLYALLAGRPPHTGPTAYEVVRRVIDEDPPAPPGEPGVIAMKALEKDPARRYATAAEFADDLDRWLRGEAILARPASWAYRMRKRVARQPAAWAFGALLVAAIAGGSAWGVTELFWRVRAEERARIEAEGRLALADAQAMVDEARARIAEVDAAMYIEGCTLAPYFDVLVEVRARCGEALARSPGFAPAHYWIGRAHLLEGRYDEAIASLRAADAPHMRAALATAILQRALAAHRSTIASAGREESLARAAEEAAGLLGEGDDLDSRIARAYVAFARGDGVALDESEAWLVAEPFARPGLEELEFVLGLADEGSTEWFDRAIGHRPGHFAALLNRADAWCDAGDHRRAIEDLTRAIEIHPRWAEAYANRAVEHEDAGEPDRAMEDYDRALELAPDLPEALFNRAYLRMERGEMDGAIADIERAAAAAPGFARIHQRRGTILVMAGRPEEAIGAFDRAIELDGGYRDAHFNRAQALADLGRWDEALAGFERVVDVDPTYAWGWEGIAEARYRQGDWDAAVGAYGRAIDLDPAGATAYLGRGLARIELEEWEGARLDLEECLNRADDETTRSMAEEALQSIDQ